MQLTTLVLAGLASQTLAWTIPAGQPDGTYAVHEDSNGNFIHEFLAKVPAPGTAVPKITLPDAELR
jgi:hypothetical protein